MRTLIALVIIVFGIVLARQHFALERTRSELNETRQYLNRAYFLLSDFDGKVTQFLQHPDPRIYILNSRIQILAEKVMTNQFYHDSIEGELEKEKELEEQIK